MKKIRNFGFLSLILLWLALVGFLWFGPKQQDSLAERRPLTQLPEISGETLLDGGFMTKFEKYTLDQFPMRDRFRQLKSLTHYYVFGQRDNNKIYIADGHAAQIEYPLDEDSVNRAIKQFQRVYDRYLKDSGSQIYATVVPDKGYYLAEENGYLALDYGKMFAQVQAGMPWAEYVDITDCLGIGNYYFTDTHWRQEALLPVAKKLSQAMGVTYPRPDDFTITQLERPFYGVYYGQAALPMKAEPMYILENDLLDSCTVYNYTENKYAPVYNMEKLYGKDQYEVFLSGSQSLLQIENPSGNPDKKLIMFRDSFGSSLAPLLVQDYARVTLVDIRYISVEVLGQFVDFQNADVLFMYSSLVLNNNLI